MLPAKDNKVSTGVARAGMFTARTLGRGCRLLTALPSSVALLSCVPSGRMIVKHVGQYLSWPTRLSNVAKEET